MVLLLYGEGATHRRAWSLSYQKDAWRSYGPLWLSAFTTVPSSCSYSESLTLQRKECQCGGEGKGGSRVLLLSCSILLFFWCSCCDAIHIHTQPMAQPMTDVYWVHEKNPCWDILLHGNTISSSVGFLRAVFQEPEWKKHFWAGTIPSWSPLYAPNPPISDYTLLISSVRGTDYYWTQKIILGIYIALFKCKVLYIINHAGIAFTTPLQAYSKIL